MKGSNEKLKICSSNNSLLILFFLIGIGLLIRLYYIPFHVPITLDGIDYFAYTVAINKEGYFPEGYLSLNFGWSTFLSPIFSLFPNYEMLELMNVQRIFSSIVSTSTAIPIYFLAREFFKKNIAVLCASLFLFEPHIIENAGLGITDPLFILFVTITIMFVFIKERKLFYLSFIFAAFATFTRYEGFLLIFPILISFIIRKDFQRNSILQIGIGITLFFTFLFMINISAYEHTDLNIISPLLGGTNYVSNFILTDTPDPDDQFFGENVENRLQVFIYNSAIGYSKYLGWILIPVLGLFIIPGLLTIKKKPTKNKIIFLLFIIFISISSIYAYGRGIQETRYLYPLIPILSLFACSFFSFLEMKFDIRKIMIVVISLIILLSIVFLEQDKTDYKFQSEIYDITLFVVKIADGVNDYDGAKFVRTASLENSWPELLEIDHRKKMTTNVKKISSEGFETLEEFLIKNKNNKLSHLVVFENDKRIFLKNIFNNENKYTFLTKVYDSERFGFENKIRIYQINYNLFNSLQN
ncbi:MAG: ArnT family glycosyltransferase [Candidatus Nitrosopumilus sp. bin_68KS]